MQTAFIETPLGIATITGDENGISKISITEDTTEKPSAKIPDVLQKAVIQLQDYFKGNRNTFDIKLNPSGTDFQKKVWHELSNIPFGKTVSYLDIAKRLGDPKCIRAAASANGKNPLWVVVPCHRVIGSDGSLTGYAGGLWRKKWLLDHENPVKQQSLF
ncbi:methylated-DNA--[protein]-cysteine S-methyltransferase [Aquimarina sp. 2201CG14-23]|uniref:methylated-DNA--[protein]-cysteine S-methyltransferase n=1 Tax=Aquimarina mycalae TaxID=3040073 RepID=UPI00247816DC|nr:methylated-DNA--[protein]-cysteine S-methyltransferase [Aquimarina sp. 2201CG14-23]MDH7447299.1 methylated-DNA--[protein]-cysteine S-methyltransferase [Aquimarina sp. 2201CG14-23]